MNPNTLVFIPAIDHPNLISSSVFKMLSQWHGSVPVKDIQVAEIDPVYAGGNDLCMHYGLPITAGANCVIINATRGSFSQVAVCIAPVNYRINFNGVVRKTLNARRVSLAPLDFILKQTEMEYGSITPIGLPLEWTILIDSRVISPPSIIIGSGLLKSKLRLPSKALEELPSAKVVENLAFHK